MKTRKVIALLIALTLLVAVFAGCAAKDEPSASTTPTANAPAGDDTAAPAETPVKVTHVLIGNSGGPRPYGYLADDNETIIGYDRDVIYAIDELLPEYEFEFSTTEFASIFAGVDSGLYQMGVNNITKKPEREEKYLFGTEFYSYNTNAFLVVKGRTDIKSINDLGGKSVYTQGDGVLFSDVFYNSYNEAHPDNPIKTKLSGADSLKQLQDLIDGVVDFALTGPISYNINKEQYPDLYAQVDYIPLPAEEAQQIEDPAAWYIYPKTDDGQKLSEAVDSALQQLISTGDLQRISTEWFGFNNTGHAHPDWPDSPPSVD
jgi:polar amino acid transport system substrate-binding protein